MNPLRAGTLPALVAGVIALAVGALYVSIIAAQGGWALSVGTNVASPDGVGAFEYCSLCEPGVVLIAGFMFGGGILAIASTLMASGRTYILAAAAGMLTFIALLVFVSSLVLIAGLPMLLAAALTIGATAQVSTLEGTNKATTFAVALLTFVAGVGGEFATIAMR